MNYNEMPIVIIDSPAQTVELMWVGQRVTVGRPPAPHVQRCWRCAPHFADDSRPAMQTQVKPPRFSVLVAAQVMADPQPQPSSSAMEEKNPSCPMEDKKDDPPQEPRAVPPAPPLDPSGLPMCAVGRYAMDNIEAFARSTEPQNEEQKIKFLRSVRALCDSAAAGNKAQELRVFCRRNEVAENIMVLLAEEPRGKLSSELWLQAIDSITALSKVDGVLEEKIPLYIVCFRSILLLPSEQDLDTKLYSKILMALDEMLHTLVFIHHNASIGEELKNVFQVSSAHGGHTEEGCPSPPQKPSGVSWGLQGRAAAPLPAGADALHLPAERGRAREGSGAHLEADPFPGASLSGDGKGSTPTVWALCPSFSLLCPLWGCTQCSTLHSQPHHSGQSRPVPYDQLCLPVLGQLVGTLILCCAFQEEKTHHCALGALHHLYTFILGRSRWEAQPDEKEKQEQWKDDHEFSLSWSTNTTVILLRFAKHFHSSERTDLILLALQGMRDCSNHNTQVASTLMAVLMVDFNPMPNDVQRIVAAIHRSRKLITEEQALRTIRGTFPWLATTSPRALTLSLLHCSPTCEKDIWELWELALSSVDVVPKMVQELLRLLEISPLGQETKAGVLPLAAATALHKLLRYLQHSPQVRLLFPELFVALVIQVVSSGELGQLQVTTIMKDPFSPSAPTSTIRMVVEAARSLMWGADMDGLATSMETNDLWARLLGAATWRSSMKSLAKMMLKSCRGQRGRTFSHLQKLLQFHQLQWREVPALTFYTELWSCQGQHKNNSRARRIFRKYIRSRKAESRELALRGLRDLYCGRMQLLLPDVLLWLQDIQAGVRLQAMRLLRDIAAQHPASIRAVIGQLAVHLLSCFNEDNAELRCRSMELFALLLEAQGRKQLLPQAKMSLLPLFIHMNEDIPNVAQAAQKALIHAAKLLGWQQLQRLAGAADVWKIADCLLQKRGRVLEQYLKQTVLHLLSPQAPVREAAVRFLGMMGRKLRNENPQVALDIREALQGARDDSEPAVRCLVQQTLLTFTALEDAPPGGTGGGAVSRWMRRIRGE
ncbi:maestro heat-like repeat-containing protein family member 7 isoform X5 [Coturnix japonica]|uniref:maestro heat-like repeat-containing protein family member 7 isoform X5 n=1 Tax=Coturnix japonica TaxID=93934 RepID=UPI0013A5EC3A|nr:maestro heat-like repeat-containing protein family member 7 isoform X5 [Coturnix japonica]